MADRVGQQLGNYHLICLLGSGGFADVYLGEHVHLGTQAAIKVLTTRLNQEDIEHFRTEARTIARLKHPQIVRVLEFGVESGTPFLVMDYAPNGTLRTLHPKGSQLPLASIVAYVRQVADALQYAHEQKLIHRDIKPENMLLGERYEVLLSDFGIATVAQSSRYQGTQEVAGTVSYMAPEQVQGHPRPASDQYALGVVVYQWLSGDRPFHGAFTEIATQHVLTPPPPLRQKIPTLSPLMEQVVMTTLAKDPKERSATVQAFATALEQAALLSNPTRVVGISTPIGQPTVLVSPSSSSDWLGLPPTLKASQPPANLANLGTTLAVYDGHSDNVNSVAWSPDGQQVTSASDDHTVDVWEAATGKHLLTYDGHSDGVLFVGWSPDGQHIASGGRDQTVQVWEAATWNHLLTYRQHPHQVYVLAWSPNGRRIASGSFDATAQVWDAATGDQLVTYEGHSKCINGLAWSPNGKRIASASDDGTVQVWDVARGQELLTYAGHVEAVWAVAWSPDGRALASGGEDGSVQIWEAATGQGILTYTGHTDHVVSVAWSPDGQRIVPASSDETVQMWEVGTGNCLFTYTGHAESVWSVAWSPNGQRIVSGSVDRTARIWQAI